MTNAQLPMDEYECGGGELPAVRPCTVIIPVYNAFCEALACVRSVMLHTRGHHSVLVIDDCSTEGQFADVLPRGLAANGRLTVLRNERNLGFVKTCNLGMRRASPQDVVLLNSDTEVTPGWLDKLQEAAFSGRKVGTVTPLTNRGTICSAPRFMCDNDLPAGYGLNEFAELVEGVSAREYAELPTCAGFCVYIKREVIDKIGLLDEEAFGRGYGEENDFSCRMQAAGYKDILDDATFVYHHGSMSFRDETNKLRAEHVKTLNRRWPHYAARLSRFVARNPLSQIHKRISDALVRRWMIGSQYTVLHVVHDSLTIKEPNCLPDGVENHVLDLIRRVPEAAHWSLYTAARQYYLTAHVPGYSREYYASVKDFDLSALISRDAFDIVHVHHVGRMDSGTLTEALLRHKRYLVDGGIFDAESAARCYHEFYRESCADCKTTSSSQLSMIGRRFREGSGDPRFSRQRMIGLAMNAVLDFFDRFHARAAVAGIVKRMLPEKAKKNLREAGRLSIHIDQASTDRLSMHTTLRSGVRRD